MKQGVTGLQAKLAGTAAITALLSLDGGTPRIQEGWPRELLEDTEEQPAAGHYPRLTFELPSIRPVADGVADMAGSIHAFTWSGHRDELDELERVIRDELDQDAWVHDGARLHATLGVSMDDPARTREEPEHRVITISLLVSEE